MVVLLAAVPLLFPLAGDELFPFTSARLFVDAPATLTRFLVVGPDGRRLPPEWLGLDVRYFGLDGYRAGKTGPHPAARAQPETYNVAGRLPEAEGISAWVAPFCRAQGLAFVDVYWNTYGSRDAAAAGVIASGHVRVTGTP